MSEQTEIPGTRLCVDPVGYAGRLEAMKGKLIGIETDLGSQHTALGLVASELLRGEPIEMDDLARKQLLDAAVAVREMLLGIGKITSAFKKDLGGLLYGVGVRFNPDFKDAGESEAE
jgi:hypothetical protein